MQKEHSTEAEGTPESLSTDKLRAEFEAQYGYGDDEALTTTGFTIKQIRWETWRHAYQAASASRAERVKELEEALEACYAELLSLNKGIGWRDGEWHEVAAARKALRKESQ